MARSAGQGKQKEREEEKGQRRKWKDINQGLWKTRGVGKEQENEASEGDDQDKWRKQK